MIRSRRTVVIAAVTGALFASAAPTGAVEEPPHSIRFEAAPGTTLSVDGLGRYADTITGVAGPGGDLQVINELGLDAYVEGLGEMPAHWHQEALKAQAVAARTYASWEARQGIWSDRGLAFDICATVACQVFHGREIIETPGVGALWQQAVEDTAGQVLSYEGGPILARYFSSSGGRTRPNEEVFPRDGHRPYLQAVDDPEDRASSPLAHWRVVFTRAQMDQILARGQRLSAVSPAADIERIRSDGTREDRVRVTGRNGHTVEVIAWEFRAFVSEVAPQLFPDSFPQQRDDGGAMPATLPTSRMDFTFEDDRVVIDGHGWGHAVGMSQYGAKGKAENGWTYEEILANYYGAIAPAVADHSPERVRVGLRWDTPEMTVTADGPVTILAADREADVASGTWTVSVDPDGSLHLEGTGPTWEPRTTTSRWVEAAAPPAEAAGPPPDDEDGSSDRLVLVRTALERAAPVLSLLGLAFGR